MSKILEIGTLNDYNGWVNYETFEVFNDMEFKELLSSYKETEIKEIETLSLDELIETFKEGYPTLKIYEGSNKLEYFKNEIEFLQQHDNSDTHYYLFNNIDEFKEYRSEVFMNMFNNNAGFIYNDIDHLIDDLKSERGLIDYVELEASNNIFLYYEVSGCNEYELMNNVLRIDENLTLNEYNNFIKHSKR